MGTESVSSSEVLLTEDLYAYEDDGIVDADVPEDGDIPVDGDPDMMLEDGEDGNWLDEMQRMKAAAEEAAQGNEMAQMAFTQPIVAGQELAEQIAQQQETAEQSTEEKDTKEQDSTRRDRVKESVGDLRRTEKAANSASRSFETGTDSHKWCKQQASMARQTRHELRKAETRLETQLAKNKAESFAKNVLKGIGQNVANAMTSVKTAFQPANGKNLMVRDGNLVEVSTPAVANGENADAPEATREKPKTTRVVREGAGPAGKQKKLSTQTRVKEGDVLENPAEANEVVEAPIVHPDDATHNQALQTAVAVSQGRDVKENEKKTERNSKILGFFKSKMSQKGEKGATAPKGSAGIFRGLMTSQFRDLTGGKRAAGGMFAGAEVLIGVEGDADLEELKQELAKMDGAGNREAATMDGLGLVGRPRVDQPKLSEETANEILTAAPGSHDEKLAKLYKNKSEAFIPDDLAQNFAQTKEVDTNRMSFQQTMQVATGGTAVG